MTNRRSADEPLVVFFTHAPVGAPRWQVAGLSLALRAAKTAKQAGFSRIVMVVHPVDVLAVQGELAALAEAEVITAAALDSHLSPSSSGLCVALAGNAVWTREFWGLLGLDRVAAQPRVVQLQLQQAPPSQLVAARMPIATLRQLLEVEGMDHAATWQQVVDHAMQGQVRQDVNASRWCAVESASDRRAAEDLLLRSLIKPTDGVISRNINRRMSTALTRRLAAYPVRPNHVTAVVLLIGLAAAPLAYQGTYLGFALGALCYYLSAVLDGVDGELSRLKFLGSPLGAWFDTVTDDAVGLAWAVGMFCGLARSSEHPYLVQLWTWLGVTAVVAYLGMVAGRYYLLITKVGAGDHQKLNAVDAGAVADPPFVAVMREIVFRTDFLPFYAFVSALVHVVPAFAVPFVVGTAAAFIDTVARLARSMAQTSSTPAGSSS